MTILASIVVAVLAATNTVMGQVYVDPNPYTIDNSTKEAWCTSQVSACPLLCRDQGHTAAAINECYPDNLYWQCVCADGKSINTTEYSQTVPYFLCTQSVTNCVNACNGNPDCGEACRANRKCGATDPTRVNTTSSAPTMSATGSGSQTSPTDGIFTGFSDGGSSSSSSSNSNSNGKNAGLGNAILLAETYGLGLMMASFAAAFMAFAQ